jgi:hypothetical protein
MASEGLSTKERAIIFTPIMVVIIIVLIFFKFKQTSKDDFYNEVVPSEFHGIIIEKYKAFNHAEPRIKYQFGNSIMDISAFNWVDLYERAKIGDSIYKNKGDTVLCLKNKKSDSIFKLNYFFDKGWSIVKR